MFFKFTKKRLNNNSPIVVDFEETFGYREKKYSSLNPLGAPPDFLEDFEGYMSKVKIRTVQSYIIEMMNLKKIEKTTDVYKRGELSRQVFHSIFSNKRKPLKDTAVQIGYGLKMDEFELIDWLEFLGYYLGESRRDNIIKYMFMKQITAREADDLLAYYNEKTIFGLL